MSDGSADEAVVKGAGFFAIDKKVWNIVCDLGVNPAIAYLVMARGTGGDQRTTSWSVNAIEKYTSISRPRAAAAVKLLLEKGFIDQKRAGKRPVYHLRAPYDVERSPNYIDANARRLVLWLTEHGATEIHQKTRLPNITACFAVAEKLRQMGVVHKNDRAEYDVIGPPEPDWLWMPNSIVDGLSDEVPPIERIWQTQNIDAIRLFANLYHAQDLRDDAGIEWRPQSGMWQVYTRDKLSSFREYTIWGFGRCEGAASGEFEPLICHRAGVARRREENGAKFWDAANALTDCGVLELVPHLVSSHSESGEIMHPNPIGSEGLPPENDIGAASRKAYTRLTGNTTLAWNGKSYWTIVPVLSHAQNVQLVGVYRLRYRPRTSATRAWLERNADLSRWVDLYDNMAADEQTGSSQFSRACNIKVTSTVGKG